MRYAILLLTLFASAAAAQQGADPLASSNSLNPLTSPALSPGALELYKLEAQFADDVAKGGGTAFASWFAEDGVTLNNGKPAILGHTAIAAATHWNAASYQLTWTPEGAQMGPSGDTGFTWGHYKGESLDAHHQKVEVNGRYITFWKKVEGRWKVALDASANDVPNSGDCCALPKP